MKCKNCGAKVFIQNKGKSHCLYCQTEYIVTPQYKSRKMIWLSLIALAISLLMIVVFLLYTLSPKSDSPKMTTMTSRAKAIELSKDKEELYAEKNASAITGLSLEKYEKIQIAGLYHSKDKKEQYYENGTTMKELLKELGPPEQLVEYTQYYPGGTAIEGKANWSSGTKLSDGKVGLYVIYDKDSDQVLRKSLSASIYALSK